MNTILAHDVAKKEARFYRRRTLSETDCNSDEKIHLNIKMTHVLPHRSFMKTDARFGAALPRRDIGDTDPQTDDHFDWRTEKELSSVSNQGTCGSCWAVATTTAVADHFSVRGLVSSVPKLSYTRSMICFSDEPCSGGNPASLLKMASESSIGFVEESCVEEESWCGSGGCTAEHFSKVYGKCGCTKDASYKCYPVDKDSVQWLIDDGRDRKFTDYVKTWIKKEGPIIAAFAVFKNFKPELFEKNIYLEAKTESGGFDRDASLDHANFLGFHAVVVVGWGVEHGVLTGPQRLQSVPYWICRNSWGSAWNGNGHFKMPMFPFNSTAQFERVVSIADVADENAVHEAGGFVTFTVKSPPFDVQIPKTIVVESGSHRLAVGAGITGVLVVCVIAIWLARRSRSQHGRRF